MLGCISPKQVLLSPKYNRLAKEYASRDPAEEAKRDFDKGSFEIYSVMTYGIGYPGVDFDVDRDF